MGPLSSRPGSWRGGWREIARRALRSVRLFGRPPFDRLARTHGLIAASDALFGVSLAGSLFFSVSVDAARPRIVLYLLVTMAPFAVVAPLVGPFVDRLAGGQRALIAATCAGRGIVCLSLASQLRTLSFYPLAFAVLVLGKTYSVAKNTLVPRLVGDPEALVEANSLLSRLATYSGAITAGLGVALLSLGEPPWVLRAAAVLYLVAAAVALRLPRPRRASSAPRDVVRQELRAPGLRQAASAMGALRAAVGFVVFLLAMALKRSGEPAWFFGAVFAAHALGGLAGTFVAPRVRRAVREETLLAWVLGLVAVLSLFAGLSPGRFVVAMLALVLGMSANAGRQAFDSLVQRDAPDVERGRLFARFETRFQLSWVLGALIAVAARPPLWLGFLLVGCVTGLGALSYIRVVPASSAEIVTRPSPGSPGEVHDSPAGRLLGTARSLAEQGQLAAAVVVAATAIDAARRAAALSGDTTVLPQAHPEASAVLEELRRTVMDGVVPSPVQVTRALALADAALGLPASSDSST